MGPRKHCTCFLGLIIVALGLVLLQDGVVVGASVAVLDGRGAAADLRGGLGERHARRGGGGARLHLQRRHRPQ